MCVCVCVLKNTVCVSCVFVCVCVCVNRDSAESYEWWAIKLNEKDYNAAHVKEDMKNTTKTSCWPVGRGTGTVHGMYLKLTANFMRKVHSSMTK